MMRLQKFLAQAGIASRRQAEILITDGKVKVNGMVVTRLGTEIDETADEIEYRGKAVRPETKKIYLALNKPVGYICSADSKQGKSVLSLVSVKERVYPVGRLDKDSSGLLILTNDGDFANEAMHPRFGKEKEYFVVCDRALSPKDQAVMEKGMRLEGKKLQPVKILSVSHDSFRIILREGINRQIRRMLGRLGYTVLRLKRVRFGRLELGSLQTGQWRKISKAEII